MGYSLRMTDRPLPGLLCELIVEKGNCYECLAPLYREALKEGRILELGVGWGRSTKTFLLACRDGGGHLWSIDWNRSFPIGGVIEAVTDLGLDTHWTLVEDNACTVPLERLPKKVDLIFIDYDEDGDYQALLGRYGELLDDGGKLYLHNTKVFPHAGEAADELATQGWVRKDIDTQYGLAVLTRRNLSRDSVVIEPE